MNKPKIIALIILSLVLALSIVLPDAVALAQSSEGKEVVWRYIFAQTVEPGREWWSEEGYHIRGRVDTGRAYGDVEGIVTVVYNGDFYQTFVPEPPSTGHLDGRAYGTIEIRDAAVIVPGWDTAPTWVGAWSYKIRGGVVVGGQLWAINTQVPAIMVIDSVKETRGAIIHSGFIDLVYCLDDTICPEPID